MIYTIPGIDGEYEFEAPRHDTQQTLKVIPDAHTLSIVPDGVSGELLIEARFPHEGAAWLAVPNGAINLDGPKTLRFTGPVGRYRFTLSGISGEGSVSISERYTAAGQGVGYGAVEYNVVPELASGPSGFRRVRVDGGEPGFWFGRQFGVSHEFSIAGGGRQVLKFATPVDAILYSAQIQVDAGGLYYRVFGYPDGSIETAAFTNPIPIFALNTMTTTPAYTGQVSAHSGGDINETGLTPFPTARIRTADNTNFRVSADAAAGMTRGFGPANAYIVMTTLTAEAVAGVLDLRFEERTWGY